MSRSLVTWRVSRFTRASRADQLLMAESLFWLVAARWSVALVPMPWLLDRMGRWDTPSGSAPETTAAGCATGRRLASAMPAIGRQIPSLGGCLTQALAAYAMLRCRGISSTLCLGVARSAGGLTAHAVLRSGGVVVTGAGADALHTPIAALRWP